jgi:hypothetical protein
MSACPTFSNLMPVKLSCILLTYPCAFDSLVREQLVEPLPQKWPDGAQPAQAYWISWKLRGNCTDPIGRIPAALPFFTGVTKEDACSALLQLRDLTAHLYHRRDASDLFPSNVSSFHDIYIQFLRKRNRSALSSRSPRDSCSEPFRQYVIRIGSPITTAYLQQNQNSDQIYLNSGRQPQCLHTLHIHPPVWRERITEATPSWAAILPNLVPRNSKSNPLSQTSP